MTSRRSNVRCALALLCLALVTWQGAEAATIYVNAVTGVDSGTCGSSKTAGATGPCKTIGQAYTNAVSGDVIALVPESEFKADGDKNLGVANSDGDIIFSKDNIIIQTDTVSTDKAVIDMQGVGIFAEFKALNSVSLKNLVIKNGGGRTGSGMGGCVRFVGKAQVALEGVDFHNCNYPGTGFGSLGGTASIMDSSPTFLNCGFYNSSSGVAGTLFIGGDADTSPQFENCHFQDSKCGESGVGGVMIPETKGGSPTWKNCTFLGSRCAYGGMVDDGNESNNQFIDCTFEDSEAMNGGFHYGFSKGNTTYTNCSFKHSISQNGGVVYMSTTATSRFINCTVENVTSMDGGAIAAEDSGISLWYDSHLTDVKATSHGGVIQCSFDSKIEVHGCTVDDFFVSTAGGFAYVDGSSTLNVTNSIVKNGRGGNGGGITMVASATTYADNLTVQNVTGDSGGAFHIYPGHGGTLTLKNSLIEDNNAIKGGGLYVQSSDSSVSITSTEFKNNEAEYGSAIYTDGAITIDNAQFTNNKAKKRYVFSVLEFDPSGTIYVRESSKIDQSPTTCDFLTNVLKISNSNFNGNEALGAGGAIFWETSREMFGLCTPSGISTAGSLTLTNNKATGYGDFIATPAQKFTSKYDSSVYPKLDFSMSFSLVDSFNQQLGGKHTALILIVDNVLTNETVAFSGSTDPVGIVIDDNGAGTIQELEAVGAPGETLTLTITPQSVLPVTTLSTTIANCPDGQNYNPTVKACEPGCSDDYWGYIVGDCKSSNIKRDVVFYWLNPKPDGSPNGCYGGLPLPATSSVECKYVPGESGMAVAFSVIAGISIAVHLVLLALMFIKSEDKVIKAGQPIFNYLVILGDIVCLCFIFVATGEASDDLCMARPIMVSLGTTISFVAMTIKAYRIDQIFNNNLVAQVKGLNTVLGYWAAAVLLDAVLFLVYGLVSPIEKTSVVDIESFGPVQHFNCIAGGDTFTVMIVAYKVFLLGIGSMYAYRTRNVSKQFSEAKPLFIVIYNTALMGTIGCGLILSGQLGTAAAMVLQSMAIFIVTTANMAILILPRLLKAMGIISTGEGDKDVFGKTTKYTAKTQKTVETKEDTV